MSKAKPNPGKQYIVRERLGQGRWKEVYRAVVRGEWHDRALARFIDVPTGKQLLEEVKLFMPGSKQVSLENVAQLYRVFKGADNDIYLEEELLYRPLESLTPLKMVDEFFGIARDLCKGLASLEAAGKIHSDLKLDNCGIDHFGVAKIFDLGSITSEGSAVKGTTLSRAPELFKDGARCTKASAVWAMGAVLFALRTGGSYPFVTKEEVRTRPHTGPAREHFDRMVRTQATDPKSESILQTRIKQAFPNGSGGLMLSMLEFDSSKRPTPDQCVEKWGALLRPWIPAVATQKVNEAENEFRDIEGYLKAYLSGTAEMSSRQWERTVSAIEQLEGKLDHRKLSALKGLGEQVKGVRQATAAAAG
jgi:serine/threonine protein kinase